MCVADTSAPCLDEAIARAERRLELSRSVIALRVAEGRDHERLDRLAGPGLAIVRQVARGHGGDARFLPEPGGRVEVVLPIGRPHDAGPRGRVRPGSAEVAAGVDMPL